MNKTIRLITALICFASCHVSVQGGTKWWDIDGATPGAGGDAPSGIWDAGTTANWSTNSAGEFASTIWSAGDDAIFSAGTNASGVFTVTVDTTQTAGNLTVEEGTVTFSGGTSLNVGGGGAGKGIIDIASGLTATLSTGLEGGDDTGQITKVGAGTLSLGGANAYGGTTIISNGIVIATSATALGSTLAPTIVSNGATLRAASSAAIAEPVVLFGNGVANSGALRCTVSPPQANGWGGGATLGSDVRINHDASGTWTWTAKQIIGTGGGTDFNLTIGGNGGSFRCNVATGSRTILLGGGSLIKEGGVELRFETPNVAGALYFNGGHFLSRSAGGSLITTNGTPSPIYVGAGAGQFRTGAAGPSYSLPNAILLSAGANPVFNPDNTFSITSNGEISGPGGLTKSKPGTLILNGANTYSGNTIITAGTLTLGAAGSISNSLVIEVRAGATFDVSAVTDGFVLGSAQTLKGGGTVQGNVTASGTLSPGASVGTLAFGGDLTIVGNLFIELDKSLSPPSDLMTVVGTLTNAGTGTVTVANLGLPLVSGLSCQLFDKPLLNGGALTIVSGGGVVWTNKLAENGSIEVLSAPPLVPATNLTIVAVSPAGFALGGLGGASQPYGIYASTDVTLPLLNWSLIGITNSDTGGVIQFVDPQGTNTQRFYRFGQ